MRPYVFLFLALGCSSPSKVVFLEPPPPGMEMDAGTPDLDATINPGDAFTEAGPDVMMCPPPPPQVDGGAAVVIAPAFQKDYYVYDLGPAPGVPGRLGGCVVSYQDPDTLFIAGDSEAPEGAIYAIKLKRDACGHILGWNGTAKLQATTPYIDANLLYTKSNLLFYSEWPNYTLGQLLPQTTTPAREINLQTFGMGGGGTGGIGFVPAYLSKPGEMRGVTWPDGLWYHIDLAADSNLYNVTKLTQTATLPNGPGGFAYVPPGSPVFAKQSVVVAEWSVSKVATYQVDGNGDPLPQTRAEFFTAFPEPWGAYFDPVSGDYIFLTWGEMPDRVFVVRGFAIPPGVTQPPN